MQNKSLKLISLGIMVLVGSWAAKQFFLSWAVWAMGGVIDREVLSANLRAEWYEQTEEDRIELALEQSEKDPSYKKIEDLQEEIDEAREDIYDPEEVIESKVEAEVEQVASEASALNKLQWFLRLKIILDLAKIAAVFIMVKGALGLVQDHQMDNLTRWFGIGTTVVILFSVLVTGVLSYFA